MEENHHPLFHQFIFLKPKSYNIQGCKTNSGEPRAIQLHSKPHYIRKKKKQQQTNQKKKPTKNPTAKKPNSWHAEFFNKGPPWLNILFTCPPLSFCCLSPCFAAGRLHRFLSLNHGYTVMLCLTVWVQFLPFLTHASPLYLAV